jgi:ABC-type nitrate/sulfonate/bicarbonate transport system substrate-binding protein
MDSRVNKKGIKAMKKKMFGMLMSIIMITTMLAGCASAPTAAPAAAAPAAAATAAPAAAAPAEAAPAAAAPAAPAAAAPKALTKVIALGETCPNISGTQIIALEKGFFKEEGLDVDLQLLVDSASSMVMIASGEAQFYSGSNYQTINLTGQKESISVVSPVVDAAGVQIVMARPGLKIKSAKDIEGKKFGVPPGAGIIMGFRKMAEDRGIDFKKVNLVYLNSQADMISALEAGEIDFAGGGEPFGQRVEAIGGTYLFRANHSYIPDNYDKDVDYLSFIVGIIVNKNYPKEHPEVVEAYLRAMMKATDFINSNPKEAAVIIGKKIGGVEPKTIEYILSLNNYYMAFDKNYKDGSAQLAQQMLDGGFTPRLIDFSEYNDTSILEKVDKSRIHFDTNQLKQ